MLIITQSLLQSSQTVKNEQTQKIIFSFVNRTGDAQQNRNSYFKKLAHEFFFQKQFFL